MLAVLSATNISFAAIIGQMLTAAQPKSVADIATILALVASTIGVVYRPWDQPDPYEHLWFERPQLKKCRNNARVKATRNIAQKLDELVSMRFCDELNRQDFMLMPFQNKKAVIFWGSQSGTSHGFAVRLERDLLLRYGLEATSADLSDFDPETISLIPESKLAIFIMSTFGEGDPSDNSADFLEYLQKQPKESLEHLQYAAFGLGNSNYQHYNRVIEVVTDSIDKMGAKSIMPLAKADDANGLTEDVFMEWKDRLLSVLEEKMDLEEHIPIYLPRLEIVEDESLDLIDLHLGDPPEKKLHSHQSAVLLLPITYSRELFKVKARNCVHMEFDLTKAASHHYKTGDYLAIWPQNPDDEVERLLSLLGMSDRRNVPVSIRSLDQGGNVHVPSTTTREALFKHYLEISAPVSRDTISSLLQFASSPNVRLFLGTLARNKAAYAEHASSHRMTLGRLLEYATSEYGEQDRATAGSWSNLPLSFVIETLNPLQPRLYSISSSSIISPRKPTITAIVTTTTLPRNPDVTIPGLTSNYINTISHRLNSTEWHPQPPLPDNQVRHNQLHAAIRKSNFRPPVFSVPLIMVGAGTGIAPFRAFVLERARLHSMGQQVGKTVLFFGCRSPDEDYLYQQELEDATASLPGAELVPAFSRVPTLSQTNGKGAYVQDVIRAKGAELGEMIESHGARVFVCGRAAMSREVCAAIRDVVGLHKGWDAERTAKWWEGWRKAGGLAEDVWG